MRKTMKVACLAALAGAALAGCGQKKGFNMPAATFSTMKVQKSDITLLSKYTANIQGRQDIAIYPQVGGTLQQLLVSEGQQVKKGQVMFVIDQVPYKAALATAEASKEAAEAQLATAQLSYNSTQTLFDQNVISDFDLQRARNTLLSAKAQVAQADAQVVNARNNLGYTEVKAPCDGVVGTLPFRVGALVSAQMGQPLTTVSDNSQMYVYFSITESQLLTMARQSGSMAQAVADMPEVTLTLVDGSTYGTPGRVETVSGVVDSKTGSVQLRAVFDNPQGLLHSGSTGNVLIPVDYKDQIVIPSAAAVQTQDKYRIYVVDAQGIATEKIVTAQKQTDGKSLIITQGLNGGEEIVASGAGMVKNGQNVKPENN